jgi:hypothetical protein
MSTFRVISLWLLRVTCVTALVGIVYVATLTTTLLDRHDVKQWLSASKLYNNNTLITSLASEQSTTDSSSFSGLSAEQNLITDEVMKNALGRTFPPSFLKQSFESVIDTSYDWIEGKRPTFTFSVPVDAKRDVFIAELVKEIEPQVAAFPLCQPYSQVLCRPNTSVPDFSRQIVTSSIDQSDFLQAPLTEATFSPTTSSQEISSLSGLPQLRSGITILLWVFVISFVVTLAGLLVFTRRESRVAMLIKVSRGAFSSMLLAVIFAGGLIVWERLGGFPLEKIIPDAGPLTPVMAAFITQLILGFSWTLFAYAGIVLVVSLACWITFSQIKKRAASALPIEPPVSPPSPLL